MYTTHRRRAELPYLFLLKVLFALLFMVTLFLFVLFAFPERTASAGNTPVRTYTITSVLIEEGDSLWSIASDFYTEEFSSLQRYISEIKRMNGLTSDTLYAGGYILVPYYTE